MTTGPSVFNLNEHSIIKKVRETLPKNITKSFNILTVQDDILFVWNYQDSSVLTLNLKLARAQNTNEIPYQTLLPSQPVAFDVERLRVNSVVSRLAISGPHGVCVLELPRRRGPNGTFGSGNDALCRNHMCDQRLFSCSKFIEVKQVKWHPGSPQDNHLLVLTSENVIRVYKVADTTICERKWTVGKEPVQAVSGSVAPRETGVDFDFASPDISKRDPNTPKSWENLLWPIYILRGNGDVYMLTTSLHEETFENAKVCGPLRMHPVDDDNYGAAACAIICLKTTPPVIAVSTSTGNIYHSVSLAPEEEQDGKEWKSVEESNSPSKALYVFESIELELGLSLSDMDATKTCPIFFHSDDTCTSRYFCTHDTGVHAITVPFVGQLENYLETTDEKDAKIQSINEASTAEYVICTHTSSSSKFNPVLGAALLFHPNYLLTLLASGQIITLPLITVLLPHVLPEFDTFQDEDSMVSPTKKILRQRFDEYIQTFLKPKLSQPLLKLNKDNPLTAQDNYDLLTRAIETFREEHFVKLNTVREEIEKRVKTLQILKVHQIEEIKRLEREKEETQSCAEKLAEKYEDIKEKQEELIKRAENLVRRVIQKQPVQTVVEKKIANELKEYDDRLKYFKKMFEQIHQKLNYQLVQIEQWRGQQKKKEQFLGSSQISTIKNSLFSMTTQISQMKTDINVCKQELGLQ